jgi:hypothetical protein
MEDRVTGLTSSVHSHTYTGTAYGYVESNLKRRMRAYKSMRMPNEGLLERG